MPASTARRSNAWKLALSKNSWEIRKSTPASTLRLRFFRSLAVGGLGVDLGVAGGADAERAALADEGDQLVGVAQAAGRDLELGLALRRVAAQGQDVVHVGVGELVEDAGQLVAGGADAGEVGHRLDAEFTLDAPTISMVRVRVLPPAP
jgi:hypothetical protein